MSATPFAVEQIEVVVESHGLMSWSAAKTLLASAGAHQATWLKPGQVCVGPLPATWPWTSRLHAWGNSDTPMWRVLGDPRRDDLVLVTSARDMATARDEVAIEASATVEPIRGQYADLCRVVVSANRPAVGSSVTFVAPTERFASA